MVLYFIIASVLILITSIILLLKKKSLQTSKIEYDNTNTNERSTLTNSNQDNDEIEENEETDNNTNNINQNNIQGNFIQIDSNRPYTKKELHKMEKKKLKADERELREQMAKMRNEKKMEDEKKYEEKEKKRKEDEKREEDIISKLKQEREQKELEEYENWGKKIFIKEEGKCKVEFNKEAFIKHIQVRKVVSIEDLAGTFKLSSHEVVAKLQKLEEEGGITGITDDRGKFIVLTDKELLSIEKHIITRGRLSKQDIIAFCNKSIKFTPSEEYRKQILNDSEVIFSSLEPKENI